MTGANFLNRFLPNCAASVGRNLNILLVTHQILQANVHARKMLKLAGQNLEKAVDELHDKLFAQAMSEKPKNIFKTREVYDILRRHLPALKKEYEKTLDKKFDLHHKIISPQHANEMAKNIFVRVVSIVLCK